MKCIKLHDIKTKEQLRVLLKYNIFARNELAFRGINHSVCDVRTICYILREIGIEFLYLPSNK